MSQWEEVLMLDIKLLEQVEQVYSCSFPMEVRQVLADWIERQDWDTASNNKSMASVLFFDLLTHLEKHCSQEQNFLCRHNLKRIYQELLEKYRTNTLHIASVISNCLKEERRIISTTTAQEQGPQDTSLQNSMVFERQQNIDKHLVLTSSMVQMLNQAMKFLDDLQDKAEFDYKILTYKVPGERNNQYTEQVSATMVQKTFSVLDFKKREVLSQMVEVIREMDALVNSQLIPELMEWKRQQQLACIGGPPLTGLDQLQNWFTLTATSLFQIKRHLDKLGEMSQRVSYKGEPIGLQRPQMEEHVKRLISHLIKSSFVVEKQPCMVSCPPLIIRTTSKFSAKVRLLVNLPEMDSRLQVKTTFDKDLPGGVATRQFCIDTHSTKEMDVESSNGGLSVEFKHLVLKEQKSPSRATRTESLLTVTEELHTISFKASLCLQGLNMDLETSSLPLVVISNSGQLPSGWASVLWYNMLTDEPRNLSFFSNPPNATWGQLAEVLSWQFSTWVRRGLDRDQLSMLGRKLLGPEESNNDCQVSWSKFCKKHLPGSSFSLWTWVVSILDLIKKYLLALWVDRCIMGFVSKTMERALLKDRAMGTFLLRFSEHQLGAITFTWVVQTKKGEVDFCSVEPFTKNKLDALPFIDILQKYKVTTDGSTLESPLKFLYPDIPKDKVFEKYYSRCEDKDSAEQYMSFVFVPVSNVSISSSPPCSSPELSILSPGTVDMICDYLCPQGSQMAVSDQQPKLLLFKQDGTGAASWLISADQQPEVDNPGFRK
ncbi:signal transducer and activator of transcription 4 [Megalops cyprinoides]|uniref:signal transducer and activator of transcription 4 n=1 Tax=Megalops cyprinoides TaxID=118141 RepID=UPI0018644874|nr:signal transducer and activator of transcription 4 [Megalops cyprinoides]